MKWWGIIGVALLAGSGCSFREAMDDYCEDTGSCECLDGSCCAFYQNRCGNIGCCGDLVCTADGYCLRPNEPQLAIEVPGNGFFDMPAVEPGERSAPTPLVIKNTGTGPTTQLRFKLEGSSVVTADFSACAGRVLQANESCQVLLTSSPTSYTEYLSTLEVEELGRSASVSIRASGGAVVEVNASSAFVTSTPAGISCPGTCKHIFPVGTAVRLSVNGSLWGTHGVLDVTRAVDSSCDPSLRTCDVVANSRVVVVSSAVPNLTLVLRGTGRIDWSANALTPPKTGSCTSTGANSFAACLVPVQDAVTFTATQGTVASWSSPCTGQANSCAYDVPALQASMLEVSFQ